MIINCANIVVSHFVCDPMKKKMLFLRLFIHPVNIYHVMFAC